MRLAVRRAPWSQLSSSIAHTGSRCTYLFASAITEEMAAVKDVTCVRHDPALRVFQIKIEKLTGFNAPPTVQLEANVSVGSNPI